MEVGDRIEVIRNGKKYEGTLMPRISGNEDIIIIKLDNGYNVGIKPDKIKLVSKRVLKKRKKVKRVKKDPNKPTIVILGMGGTIASKIDYVTGAVTPLFSPEDIVENVPELKEISNIEGREIDRKLSENVDFDDYEKLVKEIKKEMKRKVKGIIITHGTDTLHYTASALSFAIENPPLPIILVGSQRSSDRASSDGPMNLICAAQFITKTDFKGVAISMHASESDDYCHILPPCKTRKMHSSKRDAFKTVNSKPIAKVYPDGRVEFIDKPKESNIPTTTIKGKFERKVALLKVYPNMDPKIVDFFTKNKYKGIVLEGTGMGHAPIKILEPLKKFLKNGIVVMTTQCLNGRVNMNVYSTGRLLQDIGVVSGEDMLPEVAYIKLSWLLANYKSRKKVEELLKKNLRGEINERSEI
ncbi:MAG: Glu-tRNA(Gln) amidotransferase subunit GatD [Candidatus Aenigmarchaeota archaeon]|nr:Glu-tRNA(Gln) amidotransferase subunit GatD [Candidatus Aenigmarchaeota archaeon]